MTGIEDKQPVPELAGRKVAFALTKQANLTSSEQKLGLDKR